MDIYIDCEWFHTQKMFLLGYAYNLRVAGQLYGRKLNKTNINKILKSVKQTDGYIFFYGPDIGMIEKCFNLELRNNYKCCNLLKVFQRNIQSKSYKLAYFEKKCGLVRSMPQYKTNIFRMIRDWNNPKYRQRALIYNQEDVINLIKVKRILCKNHKIGKNKINQCLL